MSLAQKTALITGATRGIGLQIAKSFADQGAKTILVGRDADRLAQLQQDFCHQYNQDHQSIVMDVSNKDHVDHVFKTVLKGQQIDCLVNAAGISRDGLLIQMKERDLLDTIDTNLLGTIRVSQQVAKMMLRKRQGGCIINVASVIGMHGNVGQSAYSASKAGIIGFTKSLAKELGPYRIRVNAIAPGFIETDMTSDISKEKKQKILDAISLRRFGHVEDVSLAAVFIAQSNYFHGQILTLDGGLVL